jgi:hypothetical protein
MFSPRFSKLMGDNKTAWKAGLAIVVAGTAFKVRENSHPFPWYRRTQYEWTGVGEECVRR